MKTETSFTPAFVEAVELHLTRTNESFTMGGLETVRLRDGSMLVMSDRQGTDDFTPHLLAVINRFGEVISISPLTDPMLIDALRALVKELGR